VPQSQSPLSPPGEADADPRLAGFWLGMLRGSGPETVLAQIEVAPRDDGLISVVALWSEAGASPGREADWLQWVGAVAHASDIDGRTYYNLRLVSGNKNILAVAEPAGDEEPPSYAILQAEVDGEDRLYLRFMSPHTVARMIKNGDLAGRAVSCGEYCGFHRLELSPAELAALVRQTAPDELFGPPLGPFQRVDPAAPVIHFEAWLKGWRVE
jgi:hypothetical protein